MRTLLTLMWIIASNYVAFWSGVVLEHNDAFEHNHCEVIEDE